MMKSRERRLYSWSNATCAMPLCEALSSRRGQRPHHAPKDRVGTWDISWLAAGVSFVLGAAVRIAVADDARPREVGLRHSSCEACEQSRATCCGAGVLDADIRSFLDPVSYSPLAHEAPSNSSL